MSNQPHDWMIRLMQGYVKVHGPEKLIACVQAAIADPVDKVLLGAAVECEHQSQMEGWYERLRIPESLPLLDSTSH